MSSRPSVLSDYDDDDYDDDDDDDDDDCFYYHFWINNAVIAFGTLSSLFSCTFRSDSTHRNKSCPAYQ